MRTESAIRIVEANEHHDAYAEVELNRGHSTKVDIQDIPLVEGICWCANICGPELKQSGGRNIHVYARGTINGKKQRMHQILLGSPGLPIDHVNGDTLDNRRKNIRVSSIISNAQNRTCRRDSPTQVRGVIKVIRKLKTKTACNWVFRARINGKNFNKYFPFSEYGFLLAKNYSRDFYAQRGLRDR